MAKRILAFYKSIRTYTALGFLLLIASCAVADLNLSDHIHNYHDGQVAVFTSRGDCILSIKGEINTQLESLVVHGLDELAALDCTDRIVLLQSHGGNVSAAMNIGEHIRHHHMMTHIHGVCDSACGLIFISGIKRTVSLGTTSEPETELGFHQLKPAMGLQQCLNENQINPFLLSEIKFYLRTMLPKESADAYYSEMMGAPCKGMEYLNAHFLLDKGIATSVEW